MRFDSVNLTGPTEYATRAGAKIDILQIHHATSTSLSGLRALMAPGGRMVSANGAMSNDGHLQLVVPVDRRAFTSATPVDRRSFTVEVCNTSLAPDWGISDASHERLAQLAADMHFELGMPLDRAHIIGHREVPGTYATACPGPSMNLDRIVRRAREIAEGDDMPTAEEIAGAIWAYPLKNRGRGTTEAAGDVLGNVVRDVPAQILATPIPRAGEIDEQGKQKYTTWGDFVSYTQKFADGAKVDLDEEQLGKSIAEGLAPLIPSLVSTATDEQLDDLARRTADEADRRARERLLERNGDAPAGA